MQDDILYVTYINNALIPVPEIDLFCGYNHKPSSAKIISKHTKTPFIIGIKGVNFLIDEVKQLYYLPIFLRLSLYEGPRTTTSAVMFMR